MAIEFRALTLVVNHYGPPPRQRGGHSLPLDPLLFNDPTEVAVALA